MTIRPAAGMHCRYLEAAGSRQGNDYFNLRAADRSIPFVRQKLYFGTGGSMLARTLVSSVLSV